MLENKGMTVDFPVRKRNNIIRVSVHSILHGIIHMRKVSANVLLVDTFLYTTYEYEKIKKITFITRTNKRCRYENVVIT